MVASASRKAGSWPFWVASLDPPVDHGVGTLGTERLPVDKAFAWAVFAGQAHSGQFDKVKQEYKNP